VKIVGGWIRLPNGAQVGLATVDGTVVTPSQLDVATGTATVGGVAVVASPAEGELDEHGMRHLCRPAFDPRHGRPGRRRRGDGRPERLPDVRRRGAGRASRPAGSAAPAGTAPRQAG
jgi:hypothetical protein